MLNDKCKIMNCKFVFAKLFIVFALIGMITACDTEVENLEIQKPYTYSDLYYENLRDYKASEHQIAFMWFADYASPHTLGHRFLGLPDSLDICSLWGGIPSDVEGKTGTFYAPKVYDEMRFVQKVKGTKMVIPTIIRMDDKVRYGEMEFYKLFQESYDTSLGSEEERLKKRHKSLEMYADYLLQQMWDSELDGLDLDFEPEGDRLVGDNMVYFVEYLSNFIGPKSPNIEKLLCIDFYGAYPPSGTEVYTNYFIRQAYTQGFSEHSAGYLQSYYDAITWTSPSKFIVTENIGDHWQNGGSPFTEVDGNKYKENGERLYSLEGMARWNPIQGKKGGFGAFYGQREYSSNPPYKHMKNAIQAQNPAVK